jgi:hypothetical protein
MLFLTMGYPYNPPPGSQYPPPQNPYGPPNPYGYQPNPMMSIIACQQSVGLGGKSQMIPINYPINLQYVVQQVQMYLMSQGFQVFPMVGQNMAVIQAQHNSLLGSLTDKNQSYTIRICQGQGFVVVETGIANLMQDLLTIAATAGGTYLVGDDLLHNKLLELLGGGATAYDAYNLYKDFAQEEQLMNTIMMIIMSAPPAYPQQGYYPPPYGQQPYTQPYGQPYPQQGYYPQQTPQQNIQPQQQPQLQKQTKKCWNCGAEVDNNASFCPKCGASLNPVKCPNCGHMNSPAAKFCENCGYNLSQQNVQQKSSK